MTRHSHMLCEALKMNNNQASYREIRCAILQISRKLLDLNKPCGVQKKALKALTEELIQRWPDFFGENGDDCKHAVRCALGYIQQNHSAARCRHSISNIKGGSVRSRRKPGEKSKVTGTASENLPLNGQPSVASDSPATATTLVERMTRNLEYYSSNRSGLTQPQSSGLDEPKTPAASGQNRKVLPSEAPMTSRPRPPLTAVNGKKPTTLSPASQQTAQQSQSAGVPSSTPRSGHVNSQVSPQQSQSLTGPSVSSCSHVLPSRSCAVEAKKVPGEHTNSMACSSPGAPTHQVNVQAIHHFLQTCLPPMDHFLYRFVNAGMRTEEGLLGASRWKGELMKTFLDQLPPHADGSPVLLMEKMVLMHQFATYFM